jgi:hypothetical protein
MTFDKCKKCYKKITGITVYNRIGFCCGDCNLRFDQDYQKQTELLLETKYPFNETGLDVKTIDGGPWLDF